MGRGKHPHTGTRLQNAFLRALNSDEAVTACEKRGHQPMTARSSHPVNARLAKAQAIMTH